MKKNIITTCIITLTLAVTAAISWSLFFQQASQKDTVDINRFPKSIGTWTSVDLPLTKDDFAILETRNAFVRLYTNGVDKSQIYLYLVYSQTNRKVAHPPEICYTGSGFTIVDDAHDSIAVGYKNMNIQANRLKMFKGDLNQVAYYWFKVGDRFTSNYWKQQVLIALDTLQGHEPSSALVRISSTVGGQDINKSVKNIKNFTDLIVPSLFSYLP